MLVFDITEDQKFLLVTSGTQTELAQLKLALTVDIPNAFIIQKKAPTVNTARTFINDYGMIPINCWQYVFSVCQTYSLEVEISIKLQNYLLSFNLDFDVFNNFVKNLFEGALDNDGNEFAPYDYQIKAAYKIIKYRKSCAEISTSGGKTLISYIIIKWLLAQGENNMLYIVPSVDLADQSAEKYELYESYLKHPSDLNIGILRSGLRKKELKKIETCNILFATFQSLYRKKEDFFERFTVCIVDECHHAAASSLRNILFKTVNLNYSFGVTGTFPKEKTYENLFIQTIIGPMVYKFTAYELIYLEKKGTPINIVFEIMNYASDESKQKLFNLRTYVTIENAEDGAKVLREEQAFANNSQTRLDYIIDLACRTKKNTLILFGDIKGGYGEKLYNGIKERSEKHVFYADGGTPTENREYAKESMEEDSSGQTVIVASIGTFGEGIDIKNIHTIFLVNTAKSERIIRQICGRGIRRSPDKEYCTILDFVDDFRYANKDYPNKRYNYLWKHYLERKKIYTEHGFPTYEQSVDFTQKL